MGDHILQRLAKMRSSSSSLLLPSWPNADSDNINIISPDFSYKKQPHAKHSILNLPKLAKIGGRSSPLLPSKAKAKSKKATRAVNDDGNKAFSKSGMMTAPQRGRELDDDNESTTTNTNSSVVTIRSSSGHNDPDDDDDDDESSTLPSIHSDSITSFAGNLSPSSPSIRFRNASYISSDSDEADDCHCQHSRASFAERRRRRRQRQRAGTRSSEACHFRKRGLVVDDDLDRNIIIIEVGREIMNDDENTVLTMEVLESIMDHHGGSSPFEMRANRACGFMNCVAAYPDPIAEDEQRGAGDGEYDAGDNEFAEAVAKLFDDEGNEVLRRDVHHES